MKAVFNNFKTGKPYLINLPPPVINDDEVLIHNELSLISSGTEKFLIEFSKSSLIKKAINNKDRLNLVLKKIKTEGLLKTLEKVENKLNYPARLGYSAVGRVIDKGKNVKNISIGDRVASNSFHSEISKVTKNLCTIVPKNITNEEAIFCVPGSIALHAVRLSKPTLGENFLVIGLGLIGQLACQILNANGCNVVGVDINNERVKLAQDNKISSLKYSNNILNNIFSQLDDSIIDGIIFASNVNEKIINLYASACRKKARIIVVGGGDIQFSRDLFFRKELSIAVSCSYGPGRYDFNYEEKNIDYPIEYVRWTENRNFKSFLNLISKKKIKVSNLISSTYNIDKIEEAYTNLFSDKTLSISLIYKSKLRIYENIKNQHSTRNYGISSNTNKISFIGAGNFTNSVLLPIIYKNKDIILNKIFSPSGVSSSITAQKFKFRYSTNDLNSIFNSKDIIFITSDHKSHGKLFLKSINNHHHTYIEKPLCTNLEDLILIKNKINKSINKIVYVGYNRRFSKFTKKIQSLIGNSKIFINYDINAGETDINHWTSQDDQGGRLIGEICHFVDYCSYLSGSNIKSWTCSHHNNLNDNLTISLIFENGSSANINYITSGCDSYPKEDIKIHFDKKIINLIDFKIMHLYGFSFFKKKIISFKQDKGHDKMIESFFNDVKNNFIDRIDLQKIIYELEIIIKIKNQVN